MNIDKLQSGDQNSDPVSQIKYIAYGQNGEDIVLLRAFTGKSKGYYVDIGAGHPQEGSITKNLYDLLGWDGLEVEPLPEMASLLREARTRNTVICQAVGSKKAVRKFFRLKDNWGMSTLDPMVARRHKKNGWTIVVEKVEVNTLNDILEIHAKLPISLLKIDVEGSEASVLAEFNLKQWKPLVLLIEATEPASTTPSHHTWEKKILASGYRLALFDGLNRFYVREDQNELYDLLSVPANILDGYILLRWWKLLPLQTRGTLAQNLIKRIET